MVHFWYLNPPFALKKQLHRQNIVYYILPIGAILVLSGKL